MDAEKKKQLIDIAEMLKFCKEHNIELTKECEGFLFGIQCSENIPSFYTEEQYKGLKSNYDRLRKENETLKKELEDIKIDCFRLRTINESLKRKKRGLFS